MKNLSSQLMSNYVVVTFTKMIIIKNCTFKTSVLMLFVSHICVFADEGNKSETFKYSWKLFLDRKNSSDFFNIISKISQNNEISGGGEHYNQYI